MKDSERFAWLRLARTENIGPVTFASLIARFGTAEAALKAVPQLAARGIVVVEAAERSGSLITAQYALEQGREIFAVPGSPLDPRAKGCNRLLRDGATLTESAEDVLAVLAPILGCDFAEAGSDRADPPPENWDAEADRIRGRVAEALGPAPIAIDELIRQLGAPAGAVLTVLLELELAGRCARHPGNRVSWT